MYYSIVIAQILFVRWLVMIYIAFDIDGTLYDCSTIVGDAFAQGIDEFLKNHPELDINKPSTQEIVNLVGTPVNEIFYTLFPVLPYNLVQQLNDICTNKLSTMVLQKKGIILQGVIETIPILYNKGYTLLTASNGRKKYVQAILDAYELSHYFFNIVALEDKGLHNKTQLLTYYKNSLYDCKQLIMVGDRTNDMVAAQNNGLPFIACAFGHNAHEVEHCRWIAHSFYEIPQIVERIIENC